MKERVEEGMWEREGDGKAKSDDAVREQKICASARFGGIEISGISA